MTALFRPRATPVDGLWARLDQRGRAALLLMLVAGVALVGSQSATLARALVGGLGLVVFVVIAFANRNSALVLVVVWLVLLGFVRRALIPFTGWAEQDPLLLVSPAAAVVFLLAARGASRPRAVNALAGMALFLAVWSVLQVFNPNEPGLVVALQGVMFWIVPFLWFFVGRSISGRQHDRILRAVFWVAVVVVAYGLYQTFVDLLPFEYTWVGVSNQNEAIFLSGFRIRPFSTLTSPQEYGQFLAFAIVIIWGRLLHLPPERTRHRLWLFLFFAAAVVALFYQGTRTSMVFGLLALAVTAVLRFRSAPLALLIVVAGIGMVQWVGDQDVQAPPSDVAVEEADTADLLATHTLSGLTNPSESTLPLHIELIEQSVARGITNPFGVGVSDKTIAAVKSDTIDAPSAENDLANTLESMGTLAGFVYFAFVLTAIGVAARVYLCAPSARHLAWLGMLLAALTQWWVGSLYATSTILFLALGGLSTDAAELSGPRRPTPAARAPRTRPPVPTR